jgi:hypothetical protein
MASESDEATSAAATAATAATARNYVVLEKHLLCHLAEIREETASIESTVSVQLVFSFRYLTH